MDNLEPVTKIDPSQLPEGFSAADPNEAAAPSQQNQQDEQKESVLQQALTPDALARLRRIKLVKDKKATQVENAIVRLAMSGQLPGRINEGKLIEMLERGSAKTTTSSISIQRKRYAFDSDDEDDNDDDLM